MPFAEPMSLTRISPLILLISAWRPDIELSLTAMSHWSERPIVTVIARIGYAFSTPLGPLTMKFAETPSRSAGLIISVFGVPSSPMMPPRNGRRCARPEERRAYGEAPVRSRIEGGWAILLLAGLVHLLRVGAGLRLVLRRRSRSRVLSL